MYNLNVPIKAKDSPWYAVQMGSVASTVATNIEFFSISTKNSNYVFDFAIKHAIPRRNVTTLSSGFDRDNYPNIPICFLQETDNTAEHNPSSSTTIVIQSRRSSLPECHRLP